MSHFILSAWDKQYAFVAISANSNNKFQNGRTEKIRLSTCISFRFLSVNLNARFKQLFGPWHKLNVAINLTHYATDNADNTQSRNAIRQLCSRGFWGAGSHKYLNANDATLRDH